LLSCETVQNLKLRNDRGDDDDDEPSAWRQICYTKDSTQGKQRVVCHCFPMNDSVIRRVSAVLSGIQTTTSNVPTQGIKPPITK